MLFTRRPVPVVITDAPEDPEKEFRRRRLRYVLMMSVRVVCIIAAAILVSARPPLMGLWLTLCALGMVVVPWLAVVIANDAPVKKRDRRQPTTAAPEQTALPAPDVSRVIDVDEVTEMARPAETPPAEKPPAETPPAKADDKS